MPYVSSYLILGTVTFFQKAEGKEARYWKVRNPYAFFRIELTSGINADHLFENWMQFFAGLDQ
jgi:hypothetical protein